MLQVDALEDMVSADVVRHRSIWRSDLPATKNSNIEDPTKPCISGFLQKFTQGGKGSHIKYVSVYPSAMIDWKDQPTECKKTLEARVVSVSANVSDLKNKKDLTPEEKSRAFSIQTTGKTLVLVAPSVEDRQLWLDTINELLSRQRSS